MTKNELLEFRRLVGLSTDRLPPGPQARTMGISEEIAMQPFVAPGTISESDISDLKTAAAQTITDLKGSIAEARQNIAFIENALTNEDWQALLDLANGADAKA